jgi:multiple sugar transport system substrate-binding protein
MSNILSRRRFLEWSLAGSAMALLAACTPETEDVAVEVDEGEVVEPAEQEEATEAQEEIRLRYQARHGEDEGQDLWGGFFEYFYDKYPNIKVDWTPNPGTDLVEHLTSQMAAGDAPDVYQLCCWPSAFFIQKGEALNLQPYIDRDAEEINMDDFYSQQFNPWRLNGDIHFMPYYTGTVCVYYNKDMFDAEGVEYPPTEWGELTFDKFREIATQFVNREQPITWGVSNYGLSANWLTQYWLRGFGAAMVNPEDDTECLLCEPEAQECLEIMREMIFEDHSFAQGSELGGMGVNSLFSGERIAMKEIGSWSLRETVEACQFNWDVAPMWEGPGGITSHQSVDGQGAWSRTTHPDEAWLLVKEVASPTFEELNVRFGGLQPSRKSVLPMYVETMREKFPVLENVNIELFAQAIENNIGEPDRMFRNDSVSKNQILQPAFERVLVQGDAPVELICRHAEVVTRFNRDEIPLEDIGSELEEVAAEF